MGDKNDLWDCDKKVNNKVVLVSDETFELGRKQGALEELKDLIKVLDESFGMPKYTGELPIKYIKNRIKELEGSE